MLSTKKEVEKKRIEFEAKFLAAVKLLGRT